MLKAVGCKEGKLEVVEIETPTPGKGQLLIDVLRCGICGSDLHARSHCDDVFPVMEEVGFDKFMRSNQQVVLGHEFCGEVAEVGPKTKGAPAPGTTVVSLPLIKKGGEVLGSGLSAEAPGGYAEQMLVEQSLTLPVPNGLPVDIATMTEPMAVGLHAVNKGDVGKRRTAVVIGCGPVGLAVILLLKAKGVRTVVASDYSPGRRALAAACGADVVVDPSEESPFADATDHGHLTSAPDVFGLAVGTMEKLSKLPISWHHIWRAADAVGAAEPKSPVIFECVGVPGVIDQLITQAPFFSRVVVVGVCMGDDKIRPTMAINKEIELRFVLGYTPLEFRDTLHMLAEGEVDPSPMLTGKVGLAGVDGAFTALGDPESHAKIQIDPKSDLTI